MTPDPRSALPQITRRHFVAGSLLAPAAMQAADSATPWYQRTYRWGQTNITEKDPIRYDIPWWRGFWKRTLVQGVIVNAGGIVAYYPSKFPLQHRAEFLNGRDLYGELAQAAHDDGLAVLARMDSNRTSEDFFRAHPDWFARDAKGAPIRAADKYVTCVNSPYYDEYIPDVMREIIGRSHPEGLTDNSWSGLGRDTICYCANCAAKFKRQTGAALPSKHDWNDAVYRQWIDWNYARRIEIWDLNNRVTKSAGGPNCLWIGMNSGNIANQSRSFRDCKVIWQRAEMLLMDHQARGANGFQENADTGRLIHGVAGWDKLVPESMAMYQAGGRVSFRMAAKPAPEARMWMIEGFAGGIQPWWHHVGAYGEDRRAYATAEPLMRFYKDNEAFLTNRRPVASVGVAWSQRNTDFYGREQASELVEMPYRGFTKALLRNRIPYVPVHLDDIGKAGVRVMVLPNVAAMSDAQAAGVRAFAASGGAVIASGVTSLYNELGDARGDFALADLFGAHWSGQPGVERAWATQAIHTYLRLTPELRAEVPGPHTGDEPKIAGRRQPILTGFDETDIVAFGGTLGPLRVDRGANVLLTYVPEFPVYPPETAWMRTEKTDLPGLVMNGRHALLAADLDRRYAREGLPDHGQLLANLVRWAAGDSIPMHVEGHGLLDCNLYRQAGRLVLHLVNLTAEGSGREPLDDLVPAGPFAVRVRLPKDVKGGAVSLRVAGTRAPVKVESGWARFEVRSILDHELAVIE